MHKDNFDKGIDIGITENPLGFIYGKDVFGPTVENRRLDDIRSSLLDPKCEGPDIVYSIAMDVGKTVHKALLQKQHLLFGVVAYAKGSLGMEPIRSQGHIHKVSPFSQWSTPEVYEIWNGEAVIYMQESATDEPGRCYAVYAQPGDVVVVPPYWVHATISRMQMNLLCLVHGVTVNMVLNMLRFVVIKVLHGILFLRVMD